LDRRCADNSDDEEEVDCDIDTEEEYPDQIISQTMSESDDLVRESMDSKHLVSRSIKTQK